MILSAVFVLVVELPTKSSLQDDDRSEILEVCQRRLHMVCCPQESIRPVSSWKVNCRVLMSASNWPPSHRILAQKLVPAFKSRTVARKSSIGGLYVCAVGAFHSSRGAWHSNFTKIPLIYGVSYLNLGEHGAFFGGISPPKPPSGDGTRRMLSLGTGWIATIYRVIGISQGCVLAPLLFIVYLSSSQRGANAPPLGRGKILVGRGVWRHETILVEMQNEKALVHNQTDW